VFVFGPTEEGVFVQVKSDAVYYAVSVSTGRQGNFDLYIHTHLGHRDHLICIWPLCCACRRTLHLRHVGIAQVVVVNVIYLVIQ
jgi:hypothetical protein